MMRMKKEKNNPRTNGKHKINHILAVPRRVLFVQTFSIFGDDVYLWECVERSDAHLFSYIVCMRVTEELRHAAAGDKHSALKAAC